MNSISKRGIHLSSFASLHFQRLPANNFNILARHFSKGIPARNTTTAGNDKKEPQPRLFDPNAIFVLSVPITTRHSYIYCNHSFSLLGANQKLPWLITVENKLVSLALRVWDKLHKSQFIVNKKIVDWARKLLDTIPYNESCLKSFPSKTVMIREINGQEAKNKRTIMLTGELQKSNIDLAQLKPIPVYHPLFQDALTIVEQMKTFRNELGTYHKKRAMWCALGIPVSLPLALIPVLPNVPGFYFAYRLYCHVKALTGVRNMGYLLESESGEADNDMVHLSFEPTAGLDKVYSLAQDVKENQDETVVLTHDAIDALMNTTGLHHLADELHKALRQEIARLERGRQQ